MNQSKTIDLYNDRYQKGYMEQWPQWKIDRVNQIISELKLPKKGVALDFGCGNGFWSNVLKNLLPDWEVYGVDISQVALDHAQHRAPSCTFISDSELKAKGISFDLIFSHHVLEHVTHIEGVINEISNMLNKEGYTFHILPCSHPDSFEYKLCSLMNGGIRNDSSRTYFYEDPAHLRRMTAHEINELFFSNGLKVYKNYFARQYYGAIDWLTGKGPNFILFVCKIKNSKNLLCFFKLLMIYLYLTSIAVCRFMKLPPNPNNKRKKIRKYLYPFAIICYPFSGLVNQYWSSKRDKEWSTKKERQNGSEMYVVYKNAQ
ncbi:MAG: class I SAM-dependent methyltransferase [Pseudomonadota bacterium]|nr:class I SAM-dependent methyltransferase [Pseudomonadota bacterium]